MIYEKKTATTDNNPKPEATSTRKVAVKKTVAADVENSDKVISEVPENTTTPKNTVKTKTSPVLKKEIRETESSTELEVKNELSTTKIVIEISSKDLIKKIKKDIKIDKKKIKELQNDIKKEKKNIKKESKSKKKK